MILSFCTIILSESSTIIRDVLPTLISISIAVLLFIIGRTFDHRIRSKEIRRNWLLNVVSPRINILDNFINIVRETSENSIQELIKNKSIPHNDYMSKKATIIREIQNPRRAFEFDFLLLVRSGLPKTATNLTNILNQLEDEIKNTLDKETHNTLDIDSVNDSLKKFKNCFLTELFSSIN